VSDFQLAGQYLVILSQHCKTPMLAYQHLQHCKS